MLTEAALLPRGIRRCSLPHMKNIQIVDGAANATFSIFQATEEEFAAIFPHGRDLELVEHFIDRSGEERAGAVLGSLWERPIRKSDVRGIQGTLFYQRKPSFIPATKRDADWPETWINDAERRLRASARTIPPLIVSVTDLVRNFASACHALTPMLDKAGVPWRDEAKWDNWDRVSEPLFRSLVTEPCAFEAVGEANLGRLYIAGYDFEANPENNAYIAVEDEGRLLPMTGLLSVHEPFDYVRCSLAGEEELFLLKYADFAFVYPGPDCTSRLLREVNLNAE